MKIIKNSDIKFKLNSKIVYVEDFDMTFYTVNKENFFLKKSSSDVVEEDGYFWLNLAWEDLEYLGRGVMNYDCTNNYNDPEFPDDEYNYFLTKATDYFIDTFEVTPSDGKSINEKIDELQEGLSAETTVRSEADTALSGAIESEISARTSADEVLSGAISGFNTEIAAVRADLDNEVSARTQADEALDQAISNEVSARTEADSALSGAIDSEISARTQAISDEASARTSADEALSGAIDTEVSARTQAISDEASARTEADATLQSNIDAETSARTAADEALGSRIDDLTSGTTEALNEEISARTQADEALQTAIDNEVSARTEADATLQSNIDTETSARTAADEALSGAVDTALLSYFNGAEYVSSAKTINFKHDSTVLATIDATDFIKDGMVENVVISGGNIVITFNTDAGKESISIPLTDIFDPSNYYDKTAVDNAISAATSGKADSTVTDAISGVVSAHTANTDIHVTSGDKATWNAKQDTLVAGENITISGNVISAAGAEADDHFDSASTNPVENRVVTSAVTVPEGVYWNEKRTTYYSELGPDKNIHAFRVIPSPYEWETPPDSFAFSVTYNVGSSQTWYVEISVTSFSGKTLDCGDQNIEFTWGENELIITCSEYTLRGINLNGGYFVQIPSIVYSGGVVNDFADTIAKNVARVDSMAINALTQAYFTQNGDKITYYKTWADERAESDNFSENYFDDNDFVVKNGKFVSNLGVLLGYSQWNEIDVPTYGTNWLDIPKTDAIRLTFINYSTETYYNLTVPIYNESQHWFNSTPVNVQYGGVLDYDTTYISNVTLSEGVLTVYPQTDWVIKNQLYSSQEINNTYSKIEYSTEAKTPIVEYAQATQSGLTAHTSDSDIHVTSGDKATWNAKVDSEDLTAYTTTAVTDALNTVVTGHTANTEIHVTSSDKATWSGKQDALVAGENITISGNVISATGGGGDLSNYYTKSEVDEMSEVAAQGINDLNTNKLDVTAYTPTDLSQYWTSAQTQSAITQSVSGKQDTLSAGTGIDITSNVISVTGGGSSVTVVQTTGTSSADVMSQSAVTSALSEKVNITDNDVSALTDFKVALKLGYDYTSDNISTFFLRRSVTNNGSGALAYITTTDTNYPSITINGSWNNNGITAITTTNGITSTVTNGVAQITLTGGSLVTVDATASGGGAFIYKQYSSGQTADVVEGAVYDALEELSNIKLDYFYSNETINGAKTFLWGGTNGKPIVFKQSRDDAKIGFTCHNSAATNNEIATFELRPNTFTVDNVSHPLLYFGHYRTTAIGNAGVPQTVIGFRQYDQPNSAAYHFLMPLPEKAKTPFSLTTSFKNFYAPLGFKVDTGGTMVSADETGVVDLSSYIGGGSSVTVVQTTGTSSADVMSQDAVTTALSGKLDSTAYTPTDLSDYYTSAQTESAISAAVSGKADTSAVTAVQDSLSGYTTTGDTNTLSGAVTAHTSDSDIHVTSGDKSTWNAKQDALVAGENITISGNVISAAGGGGKAVSGGTNISITTGETADTINCTLPITASTSIRKNDITIGNDIVNGASDYKRIVIGNGNKFTHGSSRTSSSILIGTPSSTSSVYNVVNASKCIGIGGDGIEVGYNDINGYGSIAIGFGTKSIINKSLAIGHGAVASGTTKTNINNQLTIDTSNQVYIYNKDNTEMICLQDQLGGGSSINVVQTTGTSSADVMSQDAVTTALSGKLDATAYTPTDLSDYYTSAQTESAISAAVSGKADTSAVTEAISAATSGKADTSAVTAVQDSLSGYTTTGDTNALSGTVTAHTSDSDIHVTSGDKATWNAKQDSLVSGTNIKTINGASILGSGNITVNLNIWSGSAADYAQISPKDPNTLYLVV